MLGLALEFAIDTLTASSATTLAKVRVRVGVRGLAFNEVRVRVRAATQV